MHCALRESNHAGFAPQAYPIGLAVVVPHHIAHLHVIHRLLKLKGNDQLSSLHTRITLIVIEERLVERRPVEPFLGHRRHRRRVSNDKFRVV